MEQAYEGYALKHGLKQPEKKTALSSEKVSELKAWMDEEIAKERIRDGNT
ncbi:hypothetical protein [Tautonia plasticadhaerens]|nr:hypothetical protein [Tautonia plasticadhaerens]